MVSPKLWFQFPIWCLIVFLAGCVAPVPVPQTWKKEVWRSSELNGDSLSIQERGNYTSLPVWGPEGPVLSQVGSTHVHYFLLHSASERELGFLKCDSETGVWDHFRQIDSQPTWMAIRLTKSFLSHTNSGELIIFGKDRVRHSHQLILRIGPADWYAKDFWQGLKYDPEAVSITYDSSDGLRRYDILTDIDRRSDQ